jgi:hypothetical protein
VIGPVRPGAPFDAFAEGFDPGLEGQITVAIFDQYDNVIMAPTTVGIVEVANIGLVSRYAVTLTAPEPADTYLVVWDDNASEPNSASEELLVASGAAVGGSDAGWITGEDAAECCGIDVGSDTTLLDHAAAAAVDVLFELSGRQFAGEQGPVLVRPVPRCRCPRPWYGPHADGIPFAHRCTQGCLSVVTLSGYPVREIIEVRIDGDVVDASTYRLDYSRDLVRLSDPASSTRRVWPTGQRLDLAHTEVGTWSVSYTWGADPPPVAQDAASELACQIYRACAGLGNCQIPQGTTRVTRQGVTIDRTAIAAAIKAGTLGLPMVDTFLATYNPNGVQRRTAVWSPDTDPFPYRTG